MAWDPQQPIDKQPDLKFRAAPWVFSGVSLFGFTLAAILL